MTQQGCSITYFNEFGEECHADFRVNEYHNLMELLLDKYVEDWGDCKGRAWCGTCHIEMLKGATVTEKIDHDELLRLSQIGNRTENSRLACQIPVNAELNGSIFRILKDA